MARYRLFLFDEGLSVEPESPSLGKGRKRRRGIKLEARAKVVGQKGGLTPREALSKRVASFSSGVAIGGEKFVRRVASQYQKEMGRKKERNPRAILGRGGFFVMKE